MDGSFVVALKQVLDAANTGAILMPAGLREPSNVYYLREESTGQFQRLETLPPIPRIVFGGVRELFDFLLSPSAAAFGVSRPATVWVNPSGALARGIGHARGVAECAFTVHPTFGAIVELCDDDGIPIATLLRELEGRLAGALMGGPPTSLSVVRKMIKQGTASRAAGLESLGASLLAEVESGSAPTSFAFSTPVIREIPELRRNITLRAVYGFTNDGPHCWLSAIDPDALTKWGGPGEVIAAIRLAALTSLGAAEDAPAGDLPIIVPAYFGDIDHSFNAWPC